MPQKWDDQLLFWALYVWQIFILYRHTCYSKNKVRSGRASVFEVACARIQNKCLSCGVSKSFYLNNWHGKKKYLRHQPIRFLAVLFIIFLGWLRNTTRKDFGLVQVNFPAVNRQWIIHCEFPVAVKAVCCCLCVIVFDRSSQNKHI